MTVSMTPTEITSDRSAIAPTYVGDGEFELSQLSGRRLSRAQALGLVLLADAVGDLAEPYPPDSAVWGDVEDWVRSVGLTLLEAVHLLGLPLPERADQIAGRRVIHRPKVTVMDVLRRWWQ